MGGESRVDREVRDEVSVDEEEVPGDQVSRIQVPHGIADGAGGGLDDLQGLEGRGRRGERVPLRGLDVALYLCSVRPAVYVYVSHARHSEEFEGVFEEGCVS